MSEPLSLSRIKTKTLLGWTLHAALVPALLIGCGKEDPVVVSPARAFRQER